MVNADTIGVQLEKVRDKVPQLYERDNVFFAKIGKKGDVVSSRNMRIPLQLRPGGAGGLYSPDGGDMGRGTGTKYDVAQVTPSHFKFGIEINKLAEWSTDKGEKAVQNVAKTEVKNGMAQFRAFLDKLCNQPSTGQLGAITSFASTVWTLSASNFSAAQRFHVGMKVLLADSGLTTLRTGTATITIVDDANGKITVDVNPTGIANTDVILVEGSTVSAGSVTSTALFGIPYHQNATQSGTWLNLNRANYPEVWTGNVAAGSALLSTANIRLAINKIRLALGLDALSKLQAYTHPAQTHAYEDLGIVISEIIKQGSADQSLDLLFGDKRMAGVDILESFNADPTRIDFINFDAWGRAVMQDVDFYKVGDTTVFPVYGASGGVAAAYIFYFVTSFQIFVDNPRKGSYISGLAKPAGY